MDLVPVELWASTSLTASTSGLPALQVLAFREPRPRKIAWAAAVASSSPGALAPGRRRPSAPRDGGRSLSQHDSGVVATGSLQNKVAVLLPPAAHRLELDKRTENNSMLQLQLSSNCQRSSLGNQSLEKESQCVFQLPCCQVRLEFWGRRPARHRKRACPVLQMSVPILTCWNVQEWAAGDSCFLTLPSSCCQLTNDANNHKDGSCLHAKFGPAPSVRPVSGRSSQSTRPRLQP